MRSLAAVRPASWRRAQWLHTAGGRVRRHGRVLRVTGAALATLFLMSFAVVNYEALVAQEAGVGIALDDLSHYPTHLTVDRFLVELSNLTTTETYQVTVSSDSANVGIDGCGTASQTATVTGVANHELVYLVYACTVGEATVTAEVRRTGASSAEASVSQPLQVEAIPENAIGARGQRVPAATAKAVPKAGTPGSVPNTHFSDITSNSARAKWEEPSDGGTPLTGFGLQFWRHNDVEPPYSDVFVVGAASRSHNYTGLEPATTYKWRIHACNASGSCGLWTVPIVQVTTLSQATPTPTPTAPPTGPPAKPHSISVDQRMQTSARVNWSPSSNTGGMALTGFGIRWRVKDTSWPTHAQHNADDDDRRYTMPGLSPNTKYEVSLQSCNGRDSCSAWTSPLEFRTPGMLPPAPTNLAAGTATRTSVPLTWAALTGAAKYRVEYRPGASGAWTEHDDDIGGTSHTVDGLSCGTSHQFRVTAYGNGTTYAAAWGTASAVLTASTSASGCTLPSPPAPTNLAAGTVTRTSVPLTWAALTGAAKYRVEYRPGASGAWTEHDDDIGGTSHTVDGLSCGTSHQFRVTAYGNGTTYAAAWGTASAVLTASTSASGCTTPPTVTAPGRVTGIRFPEADLGDTSFKVAWTAPSNTGGAAITRYEVNWVAGATNETESVTGPSGSSPLTETTIGDDGGETVNPATAYVVKVRACNDKCGSWSSDVSVTTKALPTPTNVKVLPASKNRAQMNWDVLIEASYYIVEYRPLRPASTNLPDPDAGWLRLDRNRTPDTSHFFRLPNFSGPIGFDDHMAYEVRVKAIKESMVNGVLTTGESAYSDTVIIMDTPITHINGDSRGTSAGKANIYWISVHHLFGDYYSQEGSNIILKFREATPMHDTAEWDLGDWTEPSHPTKAELTNIPGGEISYEHSPQSGALRRESLYAIQFIYDAVPAVGGSEANTIRAYAVRDAFVWPSDGPPMHSERIGSLPMNVDDGTREVGYHICSATFESEGETRIGAWKSVIHAGFQHWQQRIPDMAINFSGLPDGGCTDYYSDIYQSVSQTVINTLTDNGIGIMDEVIVGPLTLEALERIDRDVKGFISAATTEVLIKERIGQDAERNEVIMYDDRGPVVVTLRAAGTFHNIARSVGQHANCWYEKIDGAIRYQSNPPAMCTVTTTTTIYSGGQEKTMRSYDIFIRRGVYHGKPVSVPLSGRRGFCSDLEEGNFTGFAHMVHEVGHILGLGLGGGEKALMHPSKVRASVLSSDPSSGTCGAHPIDLMWVYAVHQAVGKAP